MPRPLLLTALALSATLAAFGEKGPVSWITIRAVTHSARPHQFTAGYTSAPSSNTICDSNGANCQTTTTPGQNHEATINTLDVTDVVESGGNRYTISCRAGWPGSNCTPMVDGAEFPAEVEGATMWVLARKGGPLGKEVRIKYHILAVQPIAAAGPAAPLTNSDVVALKHAGFSDQLMIEKIRTSRTAFAVDTPNLIALKRAGLPEGVIAAMLEASRR